MSTTLSYKSEARIAAQKDRHGGSTRLWALGDVLLCALATAITLQFGDHQSAPWPKLLIDFISAPITFALALMFGSYRTPAVSWRRELPAVFTSTALGFSVGELLAALAVTRSGLAVEFARSWGLALLLLLLARLVRHLLTGRMTTAAPAVVLLGNAAQTRRLYHALSGEIASEVTGDQRPRIAAIFSDGGQEWPEATRRNIVVSETRWAQSFAECCGIKYAILAVPEECDRETEDLFKKSAQIFEHLLVAPRLAGGEHAVAITTLARSVLALHVGSNVVDRTGKFKRFLDLLGASVLGALSLPFIVLVALAIKITSNGPVLYKQVRIGKGNRAFRTLKFRTMYTNAAGRLNEYLASDPVLREEWECVHKLRRDPRVTSVGRFLRRFSLDELPQLWNVFVGEMSLVGPRPIVVAEIEKYGRDYAAYERACPGLTGLWQVSGRNDTSYQERVDFDSYYVKNWSLGLDARIALRTFRAVISGTGAY